MQNILDIINPSNSWNLRSIIAVKILLELSDGILSTCEQIETRSCFVLKTAVSQNRKLTQFALEADLNPNRFLCCATRICSVTNTNICFVTNTNLFCDKYDSAL